MKIFINLLALSLTIGLLQGENLPLQTVQRRDTYTTAEEEYETRRVISAKCEAKKYNSNPPSVFQEIKVEGDFETEAEANSALQAKIAIKMGGALYEVTQTEYGHTAYEPNSASSNPIKNGDDSSDDYAEWNKANISAEEITAEPAPPCDEVNAAADPSVPVWTYNENNVTRNRKILKNYKFSYKISFKPKSSK